jgi:hypothetical protein
MSEISVQESIGEVVRRMETAFISGTGTLTSKYVTSDLYEDISKIYAYLESKHVTGETDSLGRDKPFFNIVLAARNVYYRATDIDRKNIQIAASKLKQTVPAFMATVLLQNWMRREDWGTFLNKWGIDLASFNASVVKFIEADAKLHSMVIPWSRIICDPIDFDSNPKIELLELTEAQLYQRIDTHGYDKDIVDQLCAALTTRELTDKSKQDQKSNYIKLYEVHLNGKLSLLTGKDKDEDTYEQQMHVISYVAKKEEGKFDDYTLVSGREEQDPYMLTALLPATDGSISLNGAVKNLFEAQWMMNHTAKAIKDRLDLSSKLLWQTADANFVGRNVLTALETGDIVVHAVNMPLTKVDNDANDVNVVQSHASMWKGLAAEINGISESMLGQQSPSGTAWRQVQAELAESHSLFELMTENKALCIEQMLRRFVIPFLKKQMDTSEEIGATLEAHNITKIDSIYAPIEAINRHNTAVKDAVLNNQLPDFQQRGLTTDQSVQEQQGIVKGELASLGNQRFFVPSNVSDQTWQDALKDLEWELEINITGEAQDKQMVLQTINTALQVITNPAYASNPAAQMLVGKALAATGVISPIELSTVTTPQPQPQTQPPVGAPANGGLPALATQNG